VLFEPAGRVQLRGGNSTKKHPGPAQRLAQTAFRLFALCQARTVLSYGNISREGLSLCLSSFLQKKASSESPVLRPFAGTSPNLRLKHKPGCIPPYVSLDRKGSVEDVLQAEREYLLEKAARPYTTDTRYFFKAVYNIVFRKKRLRR
jgi:hypothetical protein